MGSALNTRTTRRVLVVGDYDEGDEVRRLWTAEALGHFQKCESMSLPEYAKLPPGDSLALVNLGTDLAEMLEEAICNENDKVLYIPPGGTPRSASTLIGFCRHNRVRDAVSGEFTTNQVVEWRMHQFRARIARLLEGKDPYDPIGLPRPLERGEGVFIATTFEEQACSVFERGVTAAIESLGIKAINPKYEYRVGKKISDSVRDMIEGSALVIANIRETGGYHNPNVFYEVGFSEAQRKMILPCRHVTDQRPAPIDIRDTGYLDYELSLDLALRLYFGLLPKVNHGDGK